MDITKFNQKLGNRITKAVIFEKNRNFKEAINLWLEISEMTLTASKSPGLDVKFRNMLINKTEQIITHIKELKSSEAFEKGETIFKGRPPSAAFQEQYKEEIKDDNREISQKMEKASISNNFQKIEKTTIGTIPNIIENSKFKNIPEGFKEIKTSEEFKIITPHDTSYVKKRIEQANKMELFENQTESNQKDINKSLNKVDSEQSIKIELDNISKEGNIICFACGYDKNFKNADKCKNCGTNLK